MQKQKSVLAGTIIAGAVMAASGLSAGAQSTDAIRPFHVNISEEKLLDLKRRVLATQWPEQELVLIFVDLKAVFVDY